MLNSHSGFDAGAYSLLSDPSSSLHALRSSLLFGPWTFDF